MTGLASQIEQVSKILSEHQVAASVKRVVLTHRLVRYHLVLEPPCRMQQIAALTDHIAAALGLPFCRVYRLEGQVHLEMPRQLSTVRSPVPLLTLCRSLANQADGRSAYPQLAAVLGTDEDGVPLLLRFPGSGSGQVLISGEPGCGKTSLARTIVTSLVIRNSQRSLQVVAVSPGAPLFEGMPHLLAPSAVSAGEIDRQLMRLLAELDTRLEENAVNPRLLVVVDGDGDLDDGALGMLATLAAAGSEAGIHLVVCAADPDAAALAGLVEHLGVQISANGTEPGKFTIAVKGQTVNFEAAYIDEEELASAVECLRSGISVLATPAQALDIRPRRPFGRSLRLFHGQASDPKPRGGR